MIDRFLRRRLRAPEFRQPPPVPAPRRGDFQPALAATRVGLLLLGAAAAVPPTAARGDERAPAPIAAPPPPKQLAAARWRTSATVRAPRSNAALAADLTAVYFDLERGTPRKRLMRWPGPIQVRLDPRLSAHAPFVAELLATIRADADIDIRLAPPPSGEAQETIGVGRITVRLAPTYAMMRTLGASFCVSSVGNLRWRAFAAALNGATPPHAASLGWSDIVAAHKATIFIPDRAAPFQVRLCLVEEMLQTLGPAGDFFGLADSIFNDDGVHSYPTGFDRLALKLLYSDALRPGMSRAAVRGALERKLNELQPTAVGADAATARRDAEWLAALRLARSQRHPGFAAPLFAKAVALADRFSEDDPRRATAAVEAARSLLGADPVRALALLEAERARLAAARPEDALRLALIDLDRARAMLAMAETATARQKAADLAEATAPTLIAHGRDDGAALSQLIVAAAEIGRRHPHTAQRLTPQQAIWRDHAFGRPLGAEASAAAASAGLPPTRDAQDGALARALSVLAALGGGVLLLGAFRLLLVA